MFPFINLGWIPGYLQTCSMIKQQKTRNKRHQSLSVDEFGQKVMGYIDRHPRRDYIYSHKLELSKLFSECYDNGETPEECYSKILNLYGV